MPVAPIRSLALLAALTAGIACGGASSAPDGLGDTCARHAQCPDGRFCVEARCERDGSAPVDAEGWAAATYFVDDDGYCSFDHECGPWVCDDGSCVSPEAAGRPLPARRDFAYWDTSCRDVAHCPDDWVCVRGWCADAAYAPDVADDEMLMLLGAVDGDGGFVEDVLIGEAFDGEFWLDDDTAWLDDAGGLGIGGVGVGGGGVVDVGPPTCLYDDACGPGEDCLAPGVCTPDVGDEPMTWADVAMDTHYAMDDGACTGDLDCGGFVCSYGYCEPPEYVLPEVPTRAEIRYYDGSCSENADCGPWVCETGWCRDPARVD